MNRKLQNLIEDRTEKGKINTIIGSFAALLRLGGYTRKQYIHLKRSFKPLDFYDYPKEEITDRLTEWLQDRLKSIGNGNGNGNGNDIKYKGVLEKVLSENKIIIPAGFESLIQEWLKYKSEKGQSYKETGLKTFINKFLKDSNSDPIVGREMLDYSMSKNYAGLFKENKSNGNTGKSNQRVGERTNDYWNQQS